MVRVVLKPQQGIKVGTTNKYLFDPEYVVKYEQAAHDWAIKTDGLVDEEDYSSKAYAIGGTGTETNNSKYYSEQAGISATNASTSETNAGISATTASTQAGIATNKANDASASATTATTQAGIAIAKAGEASTSATNAGISETNAGNSANSASASASLAHDWATSNTVVESGQYGARYYSLQAYNANVAAQAAKDLAKDWANKTDGTVDGVEYSAKYYAEQAAQQAIPSQTGHSGEYLTTDGTALSWNTVDALPSQTGQSGKFLTTDGTTASWAEASVTPDNKSISKNTSDELQTIGVINQNDTTTAIKTWTGTKAQYEAIVTKNASTEYFCTDSGELYLGDVKIGSGAGGLEIGDIGIAPLGIEESENKRRYLNGQVISQAQFESFTDKLKSIVALYPNLATTEVNWQAEVTNSKLGQCGKFVIDDVAGTIRLPKVVNINGLQNLTALGGIKAESLPNISGDTTYQANYNKTPPSPFVNSAVTRANTLAAQSYVTAKSLEFDASLSSSTYQDNAPVQQEAVQYPYFIQVATGVETSIDVSREIELNNPFFFGQSMYSENAPYNASWLASNGSYNASTLYPDFWTQLTGVELNSSLNVGDTIEISGKTYVKRGLSVVLSTGTITDYDFVVNQTDQTFRLPLLNGEEDLPSDRYENLTLGTSGSTFIAPANGKLCLVKASSAVGQYIAIVKGSYRAGDTAGVNGEALTVEIDMSKGETAIVSYSVSGSTTLYRFVYSKGNGTLYYYVGETVQDASLVNAGAVLGQLSNKADTDYANASYIPVKTDLSNMNASSTAKSTIVSWGMPNYSAPVSKSLANGSISGKGYLLFTTKQNVGTCNITIGSTVFAIGGNYNTLDTLFVPVDNNSYACSDWSIINTLKYIPLKGV